jgi:hypothetical protein
MKCVQAVHAHLWLLQIYKKNDLSKVLSLDGRLLPEEKEHHHLKQPLPHLHIQ